MLRRGALPFAMAVPLACAAGDSVFALNHPQALHLDRGIIAASASPTPGFAAPLRRRSHEEEQDRIFLINTRAIGTRCESDAMCSGVVCETHAGRGGASGWESLSWDQLAEELAEPTPTIIYIHGNRVDCGYSKSHGLAMYRSLASRRQDDGPIRFIIWSWPSSQIRGQVRDYQVKAARTKQVGWQLAWAIDQLPVETPLAVIGYSYGARVASGALHLLAGGRLGSLELNERLHPERPPVRAAFVAAALDANWIRPGGYHGRALEQIDELLLVNNHLDPAMRFYHLAMESGARPLGYGGPRGLGQFASRVRSVDVTSAVGRHHAIEEYLASSSRVTRVLEQVAQFPARLQEEQGEPETELAARP